MYGPDRQKQVPCDEVLLSVLSIMIIANRIRVILCNEIQVPQNLPPS